MENKNELSFDGAGINGPNTYRDRVATFNLNHPDWVKKYGPMFAAAPDMAGEIRKQIGWLKHARAECSGLIRGSLLTGFDQSIKYLTAVLAKAEGR